MPRATPASQVLSTLQRACYIWLVLTHLLHALWYIGHKAIMRASDKFAKRDDTSIFNFVFNNLGGEAANLHWEPCCYTSTLRLCWCLQVDDLLNIRVFTLNDLMGKRVKYTFVQQFVLSSCCCKSENSFHQYLIFKDSFWNFSTTLNFQSCCKFLELKSAHT